MTDIDPVTLEIVSSRTDEIVRQMQYAMYRTGYSTIIRESKDTSAGVTTSDGRLIGQETQHPFHFGFFVPTIDAIFEYFEEDEINPGDSFAMNDPYIGGSPHSPDFIIATPAFHEDELVAWCVNIAHKPDIGGLVPGTSSGDARELYHEGIQTPPVKVRKRGVLDQDILNIVKNNSRIPETTAGDLQGQIGCTQLGVEEVEELVSKHGLTTVTDCFDQLIKSTSKRVRDAVSEWPDGTHEAEGFLDNDGASSDSVRIHVEVSKSGDDLEFDFTGSDIQTEGPVNIQPILVCSACYYGLLAMTDNTIPSNYGLTDTCTILLDDGSVLSPKKPAPVNHYSYTLYVVIDVVLRALGAFVPDRRVASGGGKVAISIGGTEERRIDDETYEKSFVQYEIFGSAYGGTPHGDGESCIDIHGTNCEITPVEIIETEFPTRVTRFDIATDSGGAGRYRGGIGYYRNYEILDDIEYTYRGSCHQHVASGVEGGQEAIKATCTIMREGEEQSLPTMTENVPLSEGDRIQITRPGGGGYGNPQERDHDRVVADVLDRYISSDAAADIYGIELDEETAVQRVDPSSKKD